MARTTAWRHVGVVVALLLGLLVAVQPAPAGASITDGVALELVTSGLATPVDLAAPAGDDRLFVVEKAGRVRIIEGGVLQSTPFLDITGPVDAQPLASGACSGSRSTRNTTPTAAST